MDTAQFKFGTVAYIAPPHLANADELFTNLRNFPAKHPLILYSDHDYSKQWPGIIKLNNSIEIAKTPKNKMAVNNLVFFSGLHIAARLGFTHVMVLEHDCRVVENWDEKIWSEFLSKNPNAIMGGTMVVFNPCSHNRQAAERYEKFLLETKPTRIAPISVCGSAHLAVTQPTCIFPNGAFGIYRLDWMKKMFSAIAGTPDDCIALSQKLKTWDWVVGFYLWSQFKEKSYDQVVNLDSIYSGYGNIMSSEEERRQWLTERKIFGVHQIKGKWAGPEKLPEPKVIIESSIESVNVDALRTKTLTAIQEIGEKIETPKVRLFVVTYAHDFSYLKYCLRSIKKFATGFLGTTILVPTQDVAALREIITRVGIENVTVKYGYEWKHKGNMWHVCQEMRADEWCKDADYVAHFDADCVFNSPVTPKTFFKDEKPILRYEPFETLTKRHPGTANWKIGVELCLPFPVTNESMRGFCHVYNRKTYAITRRLVEEKTKTPFNEYVRSCRNEYPSNICEYVTMGAVAIEKQPSEYFFIDLSKSTEPDRNPFPVTQFWSHRPPDQPQDIWIDGNVKNSTPLQVCQALGII